MKSSICKKIAKLLSRGASVSSICAECFKNKSARSSIINKTVGHYIKKELSAMCSNKVNSILIPKDVANFILIQQMKVHAPICYVYWNVVQLQKACEG